MGNGALLMRLGEGHTDGSSGLLGEVEAGGWDRPEGTGRAGRSMDRAVEKGAGRDCSSKEFAAVRERRGEGIMNRRVCMSMVLGGIFMLSAGLAKAQDAAPLPPMALLQVPGPEAGMIGERIELLGFEGMHGGKVVTGVPFSAVAVSESTQTLADGNLKKEDLGTQTIAGVSAQGTRITHTVPAGQIGNEKAITIVSEHWYSNDLQTVVMSKRSDPRFGDTTYTLTNIQRSAPAATRFAVPSDYQVTQGGPGRHGTRKFKQGPLPPSDN